MILLVFSDIHGSYDAARKIVDVSLRIDADFIVGCGDFEGTDIIRLIHGRYKNFFSVPGNVDGPSILHCMEKLGISIHGTLIKVNSFFIGGIGGYKMKYFLPNLIGKLEYFRPEKWILVSHFPPKKTAADRFFIGFHVGNKRIRKLVEEYMPIVCLCGHVHGSPCVSFYQKTLIVNPGPAFKLRAAIVNLEDMTAKLIRL